MQTPKTNPHSDSSGLGNEAEVDLVHRIASQDQYAFEVLYRIYYRRLTRFLDRITRRPHANEEVLDDTMFAVWRKAATFNGTSQVSTWIFAIAYRMALKALKRDRAWTQRLLLDDGEPDTAPSPEAALIEGESRSRIKRLLADLSPEQRAVIELTYYHGCAYKEIAEIVGCPVDTVKTRMFHARRKLRAVLIAEEGD
jgi:RNA polymerase sigma-70 factor (ECF subfamily)